MRHLTPALLVNTGITDLNLKNGFLKDIPESTFQAVQRIDGSTIRVTLTRPEIPRRGIAPASGIAPPVQQQSHWMPLNHGRLQQLAAGESTALQAIRREIEAGEFSSSWSDDASWLTIVWQPKPEATADRRPPALAGG